MKKNAIIIAAILTTIFASRIAFSDDETISDEQIINLVDQVCAEIQADAQGTFKKITNGIHPYKNKDDNSLYVFVYNTDVEIVAHPKKSLVGKSYKGKPDFKGKMFRDEIVENALKDTAGWVNYFYRNPGKKGLRPKTTYFKLVTGSDGNQYVVCSGKYRSINSYKQGL